MVFEFIDTTGASTQTKVLVAYCDILSQSFVIPANVNKITEIWISGWQRSETGEHIAEVGLHSSQSAEVGNWDIYLGNPRGWETDIIIGNLNIPVTPGETLYLLCRYMGTNVYGNPGTIFINDCSATQYPEGAFSQYETPGVEPCATGTWYNKNADLKFRLRGEGELPPACSDYLDMWECWNNGCYFYGGVCHENPPTSCSQCTTKGECDHYDGSPAPTCYWWPSDNKCHSSPYTGCISPVGAEGTTYCYPIYGQPPYELFKCTGGAWISQGENHPDCGFVECTDGETKCVGYDRYNCIGGAWTLVQTNDPTCGYVPCAEGSTKCVGDHLYKCTNGEWVLFESNSPDCIEDEGIMPYIPYIMIAAGIAVGVLAIVIPKKNKEKKKNG